MKITGGSFGATGSAKVSRDRLIIKGAKRAEYPSTEIKAVNASTSDSRRFGFLSFALGALILGYVGLLFLGVIGAAIGFVIALAGSFYSTSTTGAEVEMADGKMVVVTGTPREIASLTRLSL